MELARLTNENLEGEIRKAGYANMDELAHAYVLQTQGTGTTEKMTAALNIPARVASSLHINPQFRAAVDRYMTLNLLTPERRQAQLEKVMDMAEHARSEIARLQAFDVVSRQAGLKVPERQEIDDRKTVEIRITRLGSREGGYEPGTPYRPPVSARRRLGEIIDVDSIAHPESLPVGARPRGLPAPSRTPSPRVGTQAAAPEEG